METGLFRLVIVLSLLLVLTGDYYTMLAQLFQVLGSFQSTPEVPQLAPADSEISNKDEDQSDVFHSVMRSKLILTIKNACLPKLICELHATTNKDALTDSEKSLLTLIRDTSISTTAEVTSKYHFAAHMGQLIAGVDGNGCHNFYPTCPFAGLQVAKIMKKIKFH